MLKTLTNINPIIQFDPKLMPNYKSVTWMLNSSLIEEPDLLIEDKRNEGIKFYPKSNIFQYIIELNKNRIDGFGIIRVKSKQQAQYLENEIYKRIKGKHIFVKHWNQANQLDPQQYFNSLKPGVLIIVIVQRKAAMGNSINTEHIKFVYEYSPNSTLSTVVQGLLGRCCGHNKKKDQVKVFSHIKHAKAYSLFEQGKMQEFYNYLEEQNIKPSARSKVTTQYTPILAGKIQPKQNVSSRNEARELVKAELKRIFRKELFIKGTIATRFMKNQKNKTQRDWYIKKIKNNENPVATRSIEREVGKTALFYDHRSNTIYYGHRFKGETKLSISPKNNSFYTII